MKIYVRNLFLTISVLVLVVTATEALYSLPDSRGNEFYFVFMPNYHQTVNNIEASDSLMVFISSDEAANGYIEFQNEYSNTRRQVDFSIPAGGGSFKFSQYWKGYEQEGYIDDGSFVNGYNGQARKCYFYVKSNAEVSVYALSRAYKSTDGAMIFPVDVLGYDYIVASYNSNEARNTNSLTPSQFSIVAIENNTSVNVELSTDAYNEKSRNFSVTLQKGESYLVQADSSSLGYSRDLTGSRVQSNRPVAVFTGHQRSLVPNELSDKLSSRDHLFAQLPPTKTLGKMYIITPLPQPELTHNVGTDIFRIIAAHNNTELFFNDTYITTLDEGEFYEGNLTTAFVLTTNEEVMVATYKKTSGVTANAGFYNYGGDPFLLILPPKKQFLDEYTTYNLQVQESPIAGMTNEVYLEQYVTVISPTLYINKITIDNKKIDSRYFQEISNSCYSYAFVPVSDGSHHLQGEKEFGVYVCGYGYADSYGYVGGMTFYDKAEKLPIVSADTMICLGDSIKLEAKNCLQVTWSPNENIDNPYVFSPTVYPTSNTVYTATMLDSLGCSYTDQVTISIFEQSVVAGPDTTICSGERVLLQASGGVDYTWDESPTLSCSDCRYTVASPDAKTTYYVTVIGVQGCIARDSVVVDIYPDPLINAGADTAICIGEEILLKASGGVYYTWDSSPTLNCSNCQEAIASPTEKTIYYVSVIDEHGCSGRDSIVVEVYPEPLIEAGPDTTICLGEEAILKASGGVYYTWDDSPTLSCSDCQDPIASPAAKTTYYVTAIDEHGCSGRDSVIVDVYPEPLIEAGPDTTICFGEEIILKASGGINYTWDEAPTLSCSDCQDPIASPAEKTTYYVTAIDEHGCSGRDSIVVDIYPEVLIDAGVDTAICFGEEIILQASGDVKEYLWEDDESLSCIDCPNPTAKPLKTTTYYLSAIDANSCSGSDSITITVNPLPVFTVSNDTSICENQRAFLVARGDYKYQWYPTDLVECDTCAETFVYPSDQSTKYYVVATSEFGCTSLDSVFVDVVNCSVMADSVDYPARVYCFEETTTAHISNDGSQSVRIDSLVLTGIDAGNFAFSTPDTLPFVLASKESEAVSITFFPDEKTNYSAEILVFSELADIKIIGITATKERGTAELSLSVASTTHEKPGDLCKFAIGIRSQDFATVKPNMIQMQIKYNIDQFFATEEDFTIAEQLTDWSLTAKKQSNEPNTTTWDLEMLGANELNTATPLFNFEPILMLHGTTQYSMEITGVFKNREYCADVLGDADSTRIEYCVDTLRAVVIFQDDFAMETNGSIISDNLNITLTMPYDANIDLCLFDLNGRKITIFEGQAQQGKNSFTLNANQFASQLYSLQFKCGKVLLQKKIIVQ